MTAARKKTTRKASTQTRTRRSPATPALRHLSSFLAGYLHEDFLLDYDTPASALAGFLADCSVAERRGLAKDWRTFVTATEGRPWPAVRAAFAALGGAWLPPSRAALDVVFSTLD